MADNRVYVENQVLFLPKLEHGVAEIGDLWNCHTSRPTGMNIFPSSLLPGDLSWARIGASDFQLHHIKKTRDALKTVQLKGEISLEILAGLIKPEGKFEYDSKNESNSVEEALLLHYHVESFKVSTNESAKGLITEDTIRSLSREDNNERPTHVVRRILYGGDLRATIRIKSTKLGTQSLANGMAKVNVRLGPVSASGRVELAWLDKLADFDLERVIVVKAMPTPSGPQNTVDDIFSMKDSFHETLMAERHAALDEVYGVPIQFELVPLSTYMDIKPHLLYLEISSVNLNRFQDMLLIQKDFLRRDHVVGLLLNRCLTFEILLQDPTSAFSQRASNMGAAYSATCQKHHLAAGTMLEEYKRGGRTAAELETVIAAFEQEFNFLRVQQELEELVQYGYAELPGHHRPELSSLIQYFTSLRQMEPWWEGNEGLRVLLATTSSEEREIQQAQQRAIGAFLRLAGKLGGAPAVQVGIMVPSCGQTLQLRLKCLDKEELYSHDVDWMVKTLEAILVGDPADYETKFHSLATSHRLPVGFNVDELAQLPNLMFLSSRYSKVVVANTFYELSKEIRQSKGATKWQFVVTIEGVYSSDEVLRALRSWLDTIPETVRRSSAWIVGNFELGSNGSAVDRDDTPLLFIFRAGRLAAVCLDHLDILALANYLRTSPDEPDLHPLSIEQLCMKPFNRHRAQFAADAWRLMEDSAQVQRLCPLEHFPDSNNEAVERALTALKCLVLGGHSGRRQLFNIVASNVIKSVADLRSEVKPLLTENRNSAPIVSDIKFLQQANERLTEWVRKRSPDDALVFEITRSLKFDSENGFEQAKALLAEFPAKFPPELKSQIQTRVQRLGLDAVSRNLGEDLRVWITESTSTSTQSSVAAAIGLLELLEADDGASDILTPVEKLVCAPNVGDEQARAETQGKWNVSDFHGCLATLSKFRFNLALVKLDQHLNNLSVMIDPRALSPAMSSSVMALLIDMCSEDLFSTAMVAELWHNRRFCTLMRDIIINHTDLLDILVRHYSTRDSIPAVLPSELRSQLEKALSMSKKRNHHAKLESLEDFEMELLRILQSESMGDNFTPWLTECLTGNDALCQQLESFGGDVLPWWNKKGKYFEQAWGLDSVRKSSDALRQLRQPQPARTTRAARVQAQPRFQVPGSKMLHA